MRKNIQKVIEAFRVGKAAKGDSKASCSTDGVRIYSYGMMIAERLPNGWILLHPVEKGHSATTSGHLRAINQEIGTWRDALCNVHSDCLSNPEMAAHCILRQKKKAEGEAFRFNTTTGKWE